MGTTEEITDASAPSVLWKAFDVLETFSHAQRVLTLSEIARRSSLPKSTVHRVLTMLLQVQAVERVGPGFKIGLRMFSMGALSMDMRLRETAAPHLERLRRLTRQTVHFAVLHGEDVVYLEKLTSPLSPDTPALIGGRLPALQTGVGKALLAHRETAPAPVDLGTVAAAAPARGVAPVRLQEVRRRGFATDLDEAAPGLSCVAVPVLVHGRAIAAVSVAYASNAGPGGVYLNPLRETAGSLGRICASFPEHLS